MDGQRKHKQKIQEYIVRPKVTKRVAILVDGGFYKWRAHTLFGEKTAADRAQELFEYCMLHTHQRDCVCDLYRIFYYDCPPASGVIFNPISQRSVDLGKTEAFKWSVNFISELKQKRKMAERLGRLSRNSSPYVLPYNTIKSLCNGRMHWEDLKPEDLKLNIEQKGVDMRIGVDIASLVFKEQVDQIILISGDSDFVPAAKLARREGVDFILDAMGAHIADDLFEHIDGLRSQIKPYLARQQNRRKQPIDESFE